MMQILVMTEWNKSENPLRGKAPAKIIKTRSFDYLLRVQDMVDCRPFRGLGLIQEVFPIFTRKAPAKSQIYTFRRPQNENKAETPAHKLNKNIIKIAYFNYSLSSLILAQLKVTEMAIPSG